MVGLLAISCGVPTNVTVTAMLLAPLLAEHLPGWMNARAREHVHIVEADGPCHYLQRLATLHTPLIQAAAGSDRYELRRSAEVGHNLLRGPPACSRPRTPAPPRPASSPTSGGRSNSPTM